ncbi:MAG: hypothetical protein J6Y92_09940 [Lentisphaeria bacterium]|nr:hypothetical protein [Lentisphaeria bacterium]
MKQITLGLSQLIAIAWVWQQEIEPRYLPIWREYGTKCGMYRRPEKHVAAYNSLLDQILSGAKELKYTKGAMSMLAEVSSEMMNAFFPVNPVLKKYTYGLISAEKQLVKPNEEDLAEARSIIRAMMSVDSMGNPLYEPSLTLFVVSPRN